MASNQTAAPSEGRPEAIARRWPHWVAGACLAVVGAFLLLTPLDDFFSTRSYDWGHRLRQPLPVEASPVVIVYMDDESHERLKQTGTEAWNRRLHGALIRKLKEFGALTIAFDVLFRSSYPDTQATQEMLSAAREHGSVLFGATRELVAVPTGERTLRKVSAPDLDLTPPLAYGLVEEAIDDRSPREHALPLNGVEPLVWKIARTALQDPPVPATRRRWIHFYGKADQVPAVSYVDVLSNSFSQSISFSNKVVYVGSGITVPFTRGGSSDVFRTPFEEKLPGVALNAQVYLNLHRRDWLTRVPALAELAVVIVLGVLAGWIFYRCPMAWAIPLAAALIIALLVLTILLLGKAHLWFAWLIPVGVQVPAGLLASMISTNLRLAREKQSLVDRLTQSPPPAPTPPSQVATPATPAPAVAPEDHTLVTPQKALTIPNYTLIRRIGKGAYGEVWIARNAVGLHHAVKIIHRKAFEFAEPFEREFRGVQSYMPISLGHPGLVPILYVGRDTEFDCFYYAMELADDVQPSPTLDVHRYVPRSLDLDIQRTGSVPPDQCVDTGLRLAETLAYLHGQGLVHRDIKPSNVIFVRGQPKFADLGLVTRTVPGNTSPAAQQTSLYVGTKGYMPPEGSGTAAADVYALGKVLYQMAWGRAEDRFPELPSDLTDRPDHAKLVALNPVILKACEPNLHHRFQNAQELWQALRNLDPALKS